jgi:phage FluMu protein Com
MTEFRCKFCHRLLFKWEHDRVIFGRTILGDINSILIEIKCPKCHKKHIITEQNVIDKVKIKNEADLIERLHIKIS